MLAYDIEGWLETDAALWLAKAVANHKVIVECGTWKGKSCSVLCEFSDEDAHVYSVEHFRGSRDAGGESGPCAQAIADRGGLMLECLTNLKQFVSSGKLDFIVADSVKAASCWPILVGTPIDLCWIDASHHTPDVIADIVAWRQLMRPGGIMCGHDAFWSIVQDALNATLPGWNFETTMKDGDGKVYAGIWWWRVPE